MLPIGPLDCEELHFSRLEAKVIDALRAARGALGKDATSKALAYVSTLEMAGARTLLISCPGRMKALVSKVDAYLPSGSFLNPRSSSYDREFATINKILYDKIDYDGFIDQRGTRGKSAWGGWVLAKKLAERVRYCPYCNAETVYAFNFRKDGKLHLAKSAFDHFYPRSRYPFLGLSLYNLIPSCTRCNSSFKHEDYQAVREMAHPYVDDVHAGMVFDLLFKDQRAFTYCRADDIASILFLERSGKSCPGGVALGRIFHHETVYSELFKEEAADAFCSAHRYPESYIETCTNDLQKAGLPKADIERLLYRSPLDERKIDLHRHGKMIVDIVSTYRASS